MSEFKPFEMIMRIEYGGAVDDGDYMQVSCKAKPVAELVRCKDCKWWDTDGYKRGFGECPNVFCETTADWFCADGERREYDRQEN